MEDELKMKKELLISKFMNSDKIIFWKECKKYNKNIPKKSTCIDNKLL